MDLTVHFRDGSTEVIPDFESVVCLGMDKNVVKADDFSSIYLENEVTYSFVGHAAKLQANGADILYLALAK
nr:MAG TPA: hypothetical protein [Caudoviricetes sp.]